MSRHRHAPRSSEQVMPPDRTLDHPDELPVEEHTDQPRLNNERAGL